MAAALKPSGRIAAIADGPPPADHRNFRDSAPATLATLTLDSRSIHGPLLCCSRLDKARGPDRNGPQGPVKWR